jgi:hypothetical protein
MPRELARRFVHHKRPQGPLSLDEACELCERTDRVAPRSVILRTPSPTHSGGVCICFRCTISIELMALNIKSRQG